jgi:predicted HTH domain antitoxin
LDGVVDALTCRIEEVMLQVNVGLISKEGCVPFGEAVRLCGRFPALRNAPPKSS